MIIILDADGFSYIFSHTNKETPVDSPQIVTQQINEFMEQIITNTQATGYVGFLSMRGYTFRHLSTLQETYGIDTPKIYKGNRGAATPEYTQQWGAVVNSHLRHKWKFNMVSGILEVDDAVAIRAKSYRAAGIDYVIVGNDKDLYQIPGKHYSYRTHKMIEISPEEAELNKYTQVLVGDSTDNITGIPGTGPKTAEKILSASPNSATLKYVVLQEFIKHYGEREGILQFANTCNLIFMVDDVSKMKEVNSEELLELHHPAIEVQQDPVDFN